MPAQAGIHDLSSIKPRNIILVSDVATDVSDQKSICY
jgi:hypothetical protein